MWVKAFLYCICESGMWVKISLEYNSFNFYIRISDVKHTSAPWHEVVSIVRPTQNAEPGSWPLQLLLRTRFPIPHDEEQASHDDHLFHLSVGELMFSQ